METSVHKVSLRDTGSKGTNPRISDPSFDVRLSGRHRIPFAAGLIYPGGSLIWKRIRYAVILSGVVLSLHLDQVYNQLLEDADRLASYSQLIGIPVSQGGIYTADLLIPQLESIEQSSYGWIMEKFGLPSASGLAASRQSFQSYQDSINATVETLQLVGQLARYAQYIYFAVLLYSALWMLLDLCFGRQRIATVFLLALAIAANVLSTRLLNTEHTLPSITKIYSHD